MPGKIPDRWEDYIPLGSQIEGTRFITFKVPLKIELVRSMPKKEHFTPEILLKMIEEQNEQLGIVIDLTNTNRYYNPKSFNDSNTQHVKIMTEGHVVPSKRVQKQFFRAVDTFLKENADNKMLVGVHCTHGLNRTGYLVCRYMIDQLGMKPDVAIAAYNTARGHDIERKNYLEDLRTPKTPLSMNEPDEVEDEGAASHHGYQRGRGGRGRGGYDHPHRRFDQRRQGGEEGWGQNGGGGYYEQGYNQRGGKRKRDPRDNGGQAQPCRGRWGHDQGQWGQNQGRWGQDAGQWAQDEWYDGQWGQSGWGSNYGAYNNGGQWQREGASQQRRGKSRHQWTKDNDSSRQSNGHSSRSDRQ